MVDKGFLINEEIQNLGLKQYISLLRRPQHKRQLEM